MHCVDLIKSVSALGLPFDVKLVVPVRLVHTVRYVVPKATGIV